MQRKCYLITITLILVALGLAFQNFRALPMHLSDEISQEFKQTENLSIQQVEKFYLRYHGLVGDSKKPLYNHPRDYVRAKVKESDFYSKVKSMAAIDLFNSENESSNEEASSNTESESDEGEIKVRYDPLRDSGRLAYRDEWSADLGFENGAKDLDLQIYTTIDSAELRFQHKPTNNETFVNYLIHW